MKIAISVPDSVFRAAEQVARQQKKSRSQLYADAVAAYVVSHGDVGIREQLDAVYGGLVSSGASGLDPVLARAQLQPLADETW